MNRSLKKVIIVVLLELSRVAVDVLGELVGVVRVLVDTILVFARVITFLKMKKK